MLAAPITYIYNIYTDIFDAEIVHVVYRQIQWISSVFDTIFRGRDIAKMLL